MVTWSLEKLVNVCIKDLIEDGFDEEWINPKDYACLRKINIHDFRALLKPHGIVVHYVEEPLLAGDNWYITREDDDDAPGWLKSERKDI